MDEEVKVEEVQVEAPEAPESAAVEAPQEVAAEAGAAPVVEPAAAPAGAGLPQSPSAPALPEARLASSHASNEGAGLRAEEPIAPVGGKDYAAGFRELVKEHPELVGKALPEEIFQAIVFGERSPLSVYEGMMMKKLSSENETLRKEIETLRQNAETAKKAPVKASTGQPKAEPVDEFLKGFNSRY